MKQHDVGRWNGSRGLETVDGKAFYWPLWPVLLVYGAFIVAVYGRSMFFADGVLAVFGFPYALVIASHVTAAGITMLLYMAVVRGYARPMTFFFVAVAAGTLIGLLTEWGILIAPAVGYLVTRLIPAGATYSFGGGGDDGIDGLSLDVGPTVNPSYVDDSDDFPYEQHYPCPTRRMGGAASVLMSGGLLGAATVCGLSPVFDGLGASALVSIGSYQLIGGYTPLVLGAWLMLMDLRPTR